MQPDEAKEHWRVDVADEAELGIFAACLAQSLDRPTYVALQGELGAGKTTLMRHVLRALGHTGTVRSPTFTLMEVYDVTMHPICHLDLYRLADPEELELLGVRDYFADGHVWIEWAQRAEGMLPAPDLALLLSFPASVPSSGDNDAATTDMNATDEDSADAPQARELLLTPGSALGRKLVEDCMALWSEQRQRD